MLECVGDAGAREVWPNVSSADGNANGANFAIPTSVSAKVTVVLMAKYQEAIMSMNKSLDFAFSRAGVLSYMLAAGEISVRYRQQTAAFVARMI